MFRINPVGTILHDTNSSVELPEFCSQLRAAVCPEGSDWQVLNVKLVENGKMEERWEDFTSPPKYSTFRTGTQIEFTVRVVDQNPTDAYDYLRDQTFLSERVLPKYVETNWEMNGLATIQAISTIECIIYFPRGLRVEWDPETNICTVKEVPKQPEPEPQSNDTEKE